MIVLKLEMWPQGDQKRAYTLATAVASLDPKTAHTNTSRSYNWRLSRLGNKGTWKSGKVDGHNKNLRGPWDLLYRILRDAVGSRNP